MKKFGLSADDRIKSTKDFEDLFAQGKIIFSKSNKIKALFIIEKHSAFPGVKIAPAVSKKAGPAPWRNRIKRLLKEVYRLNKCGLVDPALAANAKVEIIFSCNSLNFKNNKKVTLQEVIPDMLELIHKIKNYI